MKQLVNFDYLNGFNDVKYRPNDREIIQNFSEDLEQFGVSNENLHNDTFVSTKSD